MAAQYHTPERRSTKRSTLKNRYLKVRQGRYTRTIKDKHHHRYDRSVTCQVPWINLQGRWLAEAGFTYDTPVMVEVTSGILVLYAEVDS